MQPTTSQSLPPQLASLPATNPLWPPPLQPVTYLLVPATSTSRQHPQNRRRLTHEPPHAPGSAAQMAPPVARQTAAAPQRRSRGQTQPPVPILHQAQGHPLAAPSHLRVPHPEPSMSMSSAQTDHVDAAAAASSSPETAASSPPPLPSPWGSPSQQTDRKSPQRQPSDLQWLSPGSDGAAGAHTLAIRNNHRPLAKLPHTKRGSRQFQKLTHFFHLEE